MPKEKLSRISSPSSSKVVLFVGSNPSRAGLGVPFVGTRSYSTLVRWVEQIGSARFYAVNAVDEVTAGNSPITVKLMRKHSLSLRSKVFAVKPDLVIALGNSASKALLVSGVDDHLRVAHPSGLNRQLNDVMYVDSLIKVIRSMLDLR
jgi:uracil-DNA glycosylase